jgi:acyl phosphate:glycerol-3-phosphate acyltransferase
MTTLIILTAVAYLLGSISFAVIVSRVLRLPDPRTYGSGNPGATNVLRTGRKMAAVITLLGDCLKGWLAVYMAGRYADTGMTDATMAAAALAVIVGHMYPVFFQFRGGKGVATALGVLLGLNAYLAAGSIATWLIIAAFFRISSLAALVTALFAPFFALILYHPLHPFFVAVTVFCLLLIFRHRENIRNLLAGKESRFGSGPAAPD